MSYTLIIDDNVLQPNDPKWFVYVAEVHDWSGAYVSSVPEGVMKANQAGYPVSHWMRLSSKIKMSAEAINGSKQQLDKNI